MWLRQRSICWARLSTVWAVGVRKSVGTSSGFEVLFVCLFACLIVCLYYVINRLNAKLNPICNLLALLGAHHILHVSGIRVKDISKPSSGCIPTAVWRTVNDGSGESWLLPQQHFGPPRWSLTSVIPTVDLCVSRKSGFARSCCSGAESVPLVDAYRKRANSQRTRDWRGMQHALVNLLAPEFHI
jgi:hypothetical protein